MDSDALDSQEYSAAKDRFNAYLRVLKLTLNDTQWTILGELLKARDAMATEENKYWYTRSLDRKGGQSK